LLAGVLVTVVLAALCTVAVYPLKQITTVSSLGVVYLLGVVVVATFWGLWLGIAMAILSAAAFNFFHLPPVDRFTISDSRNWVALGAFVVAALASSTVSEVARIRAVEANRRRVEADLTAEIAQLLLARTGVEEALALIGQRLSVVFDLPWASVSLAGRPGDGRRKVIGLRVGGQTLGTLTIPAETAPAVEGRLCDRVVPALAAALAVALERERLIAEAVETEGLKRSEAIKTAILRAVSHDLRSPMMTIMAAGAAVRSPDLTPAERDELGGMVVEQGGRLARMIEDLLDLSKLEANGAQPQAAECSIEDLIDGALAEQPSEAVFEVHADADLSPVRADFAQVKRALANLMENARRYSGREPVVIRARTIGSSVTIRVIDKGPGIPPGDQERIFEPFYRGAASGGEPHRGSGLGLAIAKGFVECNGGRIWIEAPSGGGACLAISLPVATVPA
jgi:two-component system sensor histidine kinase KdpD